MTGKVMFAMPTLEVNSVIMPMNKQTRVRINNGGRTRRAVKDSPILFARQEARLAFDIAKPLPKRKTRLQGIFVSITFQVSRPSEGRVGLFAAEGR